MRIAFLTLLVNACAHAPIAPRLGEGTTVLEPGEVGLTFAGAGGLGNYEISGNPLSGSGVGVEARGRLGLPHDQEVGLGGAFGLSLPSTADSITGFQLSYKISPRSWFRDRLPRLAFVGELAVMDKFVSTTWIFGVSVAAIVAPYIAKNGSQLYVGLKGVLAVPVLQNASALHEMVALPVGFSWHVSERVQLIAEAGFGLGFDQLDSGGTKTETSGYGGYSLVAFGYTFR